MTRRYILFTITALLCLIMLQPVLVKAEDGTEDYYVKIRKELTIMEGDDYTFEVETNGINGVEFYCNDEIPEGYEGETDDWGVRGYFKSEKRFYANEVGKTTVWASITVSVNTEDEFRGSYYKLVTIRDYCVVTVIPKVQKELLIGNETNIQVTDYELYQNGTYTVATQNNNGEWDEAGESPSVVTVDEDGLITAIQSGKARIYVTVPEGNEEKKVLVATITVPKGGLDTDRLIRAVGSEPRQIKLENIGGNFTIWTSDDVSVAYVDVNGLVTPIQEGKTKISANIQTISGKVVTISCPIVVTNPKLSNSELNLARGLNDRLELTGTVEDSTVQWEVSDESVLNLWNGGSFYTRAVGKSTIKVKVDGIALKCVVRVTDPRITNTQLLLVKGNKKNMGLKGLNSYSKPKWTSSDKKIATVNKQGVLNPKKVGNVTVTCEVDGVSFACSVSIGKKQAVKAVRAAESVVGAKYSQARRMQNGYYDCSSLVWRSYRQSGIYFGNRRYAPTAAEIGRNMVINKRALPLKIIKDTKQMLPGDILLYAKKEKNGRYKNISHIAIYCGNGMMVHADGKRVSKVPYWVRSDTVLVARPVK